MRIGVFSPIVHGSGASAVSMLLALKMGQGTERVCLTHISPRDSVLTALAGITSRGDSTTNPSMMVSTFQSTAQMTDEEYREFCAAVTRDVDLFTCTRMGEATCSNEESRFLIRYVAEKFLHKHIIIDCDDHSPETTKEVISYCDAVILVARVERRQIERYKEWLLEQRQAGTLTGKHILLVFNKYADVVIKHKDLAKMMGVKPHYICTIDHNDYVSWAFFNGSFPKLHEFILINDLRVAKLSSQLDTIIKNLRSQKISDLKKIEKDYFLGVKLQEKKHSFDLAAAAAEGGMAALSDGQGAKPASFASLSAGSKTASGFGIDTAPEFGQTVSGFGASEADNQLFGEPPVDSGFGQAIGLQPTFGQGVAEQGGFGQPAEQSGFGQPAFGDTTFGQPAAEQGGFGQASESNGFGQQVNVQVQVQVSNAGQQVVPEVVFTQEPVEAVEASTEELPVEDTPAIDGETLDTPALEEGGTQADEIIEQGDKPDESKKADSGNVKIAPVGVGSLPKSAAKKVASGGGLPLASIGGSAAPVKKTGKVGGGLPTVALPKK